MRQGIKPSAVLLFLFTVFIILAAISAVFPPGGLQILPGVHLHFPGFRDLFDPEKPEYADISYLTEVWDPAQDSVLLHYPEVLPPESETEMPEKAESDNATDGSVVAADEEKLRKLVFPLQYPPGNDTVMDAFYKALYNTINNTRVRIIHYGDSQIENDRITSAMRNLFQIRFGGGGPGMFPVLSPVPHNASVRVSTTGDWQRFTPLAGGKGSNNHNRYGLLLSYSKLTTHDPENDIEGSVTFRPTGIGYSRSRQMNELNLYFGYNKAPFTMELRSGEETVDAELFFPSDSLMTVSWSLSGNPEEYSIIIKGQDSPEIYSVSIDNPVGVALDNVALRGSAGLEFAGTDAALMKQMIGDLNTGLIIMQFGVNVVPHVVDDYTYYENSLFRQLRFIKSLDPDIPVIVVGVSDMSEKNQSGYPVSYPNIEKIRDAQRNAAFRAGFPFWDLYEAMGGRNSMPAWVAAEPSLGQTDYTHFSYRGSTLIGELLFNAIIAGYDNYLDSYSKSQQ